MVEARGKIKRRSTPKVKSGCKTCKTRRIKCDEKRPYCNNCLGTGRTCDGYPPSFEFRAVTINPKSKTITTSLPVSTPVPHPRVSLRRCESSDSGAENYLLVGTTLRQPKIFPGSTQEQQFFISFRQDLAPALGGYFDTEFWNTQLPRVAYSEPAVYHAIIAIAALDRDDVLEAEAPGSEQHVSFLLHYNKAIDFVKQQLQVDGRSRLIILLSCLLFICLEFKRGNTDVALNHLKSGLSILNSQACFSEPSELSDIQENLTHLFSRLGIQGSLAGQQPPEGSPHKISRPQSAYAPFANIIEARNHLIEIFIEALKPIGSDFTYEASFSTSPSEQARRATLISQLHQWNSQLGLLTTDKLSCPTPQDMRMIRLLRIQSLIAIIWNSTTIPSSDGASIEPAFDCYTKMFQTIISLAALLIEDSSPPTSSGTSPISAYSTPSTISSTSTPPPSARTTISRSQSSFSFEMGLIFALSFVAIKCRSPSIRRQATYILSRVEPRREGMWDARVMEKVSQHVIEVEESSCVEPVTEDIRTWPEENYRVHGVYVFPRCDYEARVQKIKLFWGPGSSVDRFGEQWVKDIRF